MTKTEKIKAEKKADLALVKLEDIFYLNIKSDTVARKLNDACDKIRELISSIENNE